MMPASVQYGTANEVTRETGGPRARPHPPYGGPRGRGPPRFERHRPGGGRGHWATAGLKVLAEWAVPLASDEAPQLATGVPGALGTGARPLRVPWLQAARDGSSGGRPCGRPAPCSLPRLTCRQRPQLAVASEVPYLLVLDIIDPRSYTI
jgi:hypothetical protein